MLTPAEELGLSGHSLEGQLKKLYYAMTAAEIASLQSRVIDEARQRHLIYLHEGRPEPIHVFLRPIVAQPDQLGYLHYVTLTILNALKRVPELYRKDAEVRRLFPFSQDEQDWLAQSWSCSSHDSDPVLGRLDAVIEFSSPMWKDSLKFLEPNLSGVGGIHLGPTCDQIVADLVLPMLRKNAPDLNLAPGRDLRELLIQEVVDHLEAIGRPGRNLCFIEPKYAGEGPDEQQALAEYYHQRHGLRIMHADPSELVLRDGEVTYEDQIVDMAYRDYEIRDLLALRSQSVDLRAIRTLFDQNRVISSLSGEFDHKSCWELLSDPKFTERYFSGEERQMFRRHILWTRIVSNRKTMLPDGSTGDLLSYALEERETLVLKPNRSYGGDRVLIGHLTDDAAWRTAIVQAEAEPGDWVLQRQAILPVTDFAVKDAEGEVHFEPFHVVYGFAATRYGISIVGRASQKQVVNVAQRGGMCAIFVGQANSQLRGPMR